MSTNTTSEVDICNRALALISEASITSLSDNNERAKACDAEYTINRDALLQEWEWTFATVTADIGAALSAAAPAEWSKRYTYPTNPACLAIQQVLGSTASYKVPRTEFKVELSADGTSKNILTKAAMECVRYTACITDTKLYPPLFRDALAWRLAAALALRLKVNPQRAQFAAAQYQAVKARAIAADAAEFVEMSNEDNDYLRSRL